MRGACRGDGCAKAVYIFGTDLCSSHLGRWLRRAPAEARAAVLLATIDAPVWQAWPRVSLAESGEDGLGGLREWQAGRCAICGSVEPLVTDHDHRTLLVRGLLCRSCNTAEGNADWPWLHRYRLDPPAITLGLWVEYVMPFAWAKPEAPPVSVSDLVATMRQRSWGTGILQR